MHLSSKVCVRRVGKREKKGERREHDNYRTLCSDTCARLDRGAHAAAVASRTRPLAARAAKSSRARPASTSKSPTVAVAAPKAKSVAKASHRGRAPRVTTETLGEGAPAPAAMSPTHVAAASTNAIAPNAVNDLCVNGRHAAGCKSWRCIAICDVAPCAPHTLNRVFFPLVVVPFFTFDGSCRIACPLFSFSFLGGTLACLSLSSKNRDLHRGRACERTQAAALQQNLHSQQTLLQKYYEPTLK